MQITQRQTRFAPETRSAHGPIAALVRTVLLWQERASQRHHMAGLDDHALKDIGLSRADIEGEAAKPFWRN